MTDISNNEIRKLDGALLLVFRELLRTRRGTEAASRLGVTQSSVSHSLDRLRELFADPLFIRRPHGLEPTRRALELGPRIDALLEIYGQALHRESQFDPALSDRRFVIAAPEFVTALIGAPLVQKFRTEAPKANLTITSLPPDVALDALRRGDLDLVLGRFVAVPAGIASKRLYDDTYCVVARTRHPRIKGKIDRQTYAKTGHVYAQSRSEGGDPEETAPEPDILATAIVPRWLTALSIVAGTDAIATCPRRLAERQAQTMKLQVLDPPFRSLKISVRIARREGGVDLGLDWLEEQVRLAVE